MPSLITACRQISHEASEYLDQYIVIEMTSTFPEISLKIKPWSSHEALFRDLLTGMRARASRFENVIELHVPRRMEGCTIYSVYRRAMEGHRREHVGATSAHFPKLKKIVCWVRHAMKSESREKTEVILRVWVDKPDLLVEFRR